MFAFLIFFLTIWLGQLDLNSEYKPRVVILTDINLVGGDPDDRQSWIHLLWYSDELEIEAVIPDYWNGQGYEACLFGLEAYSKDYALNSWDELDYPSTKSIESKIVRSEEQAIERLKDLSAEEDDPLYVLVWGRMKTIQKALFKYPEISNRIRILTIGTGRKYGPKDEVPGEDCDVVNWNGEGRNEIFNDPRFKEMWWLESNWTYNGMFVEPGPTEMFEKLQDYGAMGKNIKEVTSRHEWAQYFRVGDTPSVLYLLDPNHDINRPDLSSWAGKFKKPFPDIRPNYYTDDNGSIAWNYEDPCNSWENLQEMYAFNKSTLLERRAEMYDALLTKLDSIYSK